MQITLQIPDNVNLTEDVKELLSSLPEEKKHELALTLLERTLTNVNSQFMQNVAINQALKDMNEIYKDYSFYYGPKDERDRSGYRSTDDDVSALRAIVS